MRKIDLMIVGAQKAGTTSLKNYLNEHPETLGHLTTELPYFIERKSFNIDYNDIFKQYFTEGNPNNARIVIGKAVGMSYNEESIKRLYEHNPECKIIFIVRNPTQRTFSAFNMELTNGWLKNSFDELMEVVKNDNYEHGMYSLFIRLSMYTDHLKILKKYFPDKQIKVVSFDILKQEPLNVCRDIFTWMEIDNTFQPRINVSHNITGRPKSRKASTILLKLRNNNNPIKKFVKWILPYRYFTKLGNSLVEMNISNKKYEPLKPEYKTILDEHFYPMILELEKQTGLDLKNWYPTK